MSSDTDSSTSSTPSDDCNKRRSLRKSKRKSEKKHKKDKKVKKRHKQKTRSRRDSSDEGTGTSHSPPMPILPAPLLSKDEEKSAFGPALPPHLLQRRLVVDEEESMPKIIGPIMPSTFIKPEVDSATAIITKPTAASAIEDETVDDFVYGPVPIAVGGDETQMSATQRELEQRALELKLAAIESANATTIDQTVREEWMLELPEVGLKTGLAALANLKRTFHHGKERPDFSDRSSWTKTPLGDGDTPQKSSTSKSAREEQKQEADAYYVRQRDAEQESIAKKHKKKHKRDESLVEIHQKKLRKEQRQKEKELAASGVKAERRPFTRDVDLKLNKIDSHQTKQIVDKAKILNTKFSSGQTKYL